MSDTLLAEVLGMARALGELTARVAALEARPVGHTSTDIISGKVAAFITALARGNPDLHRHLTTEARALLAQGVDEEAVMEKLRVGSR